MTRPVALELIERHLVEGDPTPGEEIAVRIDQTLTQDATGTMVMLELEAMGLDRVRTDLSVQYVDHNILQTDDRNADDHRFLASACRRFGLWFSKPGNGVSHPVHQHHFGVPGATLLGSDSHTCAAGALGMLAIGAGGLDVAAAMAGEPFRFRMPEIWGVRLTGELPPWVSAKDVILEMLRRHGVDGGVDRIIEYHGPGVAALSTWDRHVIANMGAELGATTTVFPADGEVRRFLTSVGRDHAWTEITNEGATYDVTDEIDLESLEPLIARPSSPGDVVPVREIAGESIGQVIIGSSANPGPRDFAVPAMMVQDRQTDPGVSFEINPSSREVLEFLSLKGYLGDLVRAGARVQQSGCMGCIGMGQAPGSGQASLRTMPRNFPGRSGTRGDRVFLCSPETATASALTGVITDPRDSGLPEPSWTEPDLLPVNRDMLVAPPSHGPEGRELERSPNIVTLPAFDPLPNAVEGPVLLKLGDDVSTDEILPAGSRVLPYRSNLPAIAEFAFDAVDDTYPRRARRADGPHLVVAGWNYGQGSSREHAAAAPRVLGLRAVLAKSYARIYWQNLANFGVLPLEFADPRDHDRIEPGDRLRLLGLRDALESGSRAIRVENGSRRQIYTAVQRLSKAQRDAVLAGSLMNVLRRGRLALAGSGQVE